TIPASLTEIVAPVAVRIRIPPVGPGTSLTTMPFWSVVWIVKLSMAGGTARAIAGSSAGLPQKPPTQIGRSGSPCSNSTHTPDPTGGSVNRPVLTPAPGRHGIAHELGTTFDASVTITWMRPICIGSTLLTTVARYLP